MLNASHCQRRMAIFKQRCQWWRSAYADALASAAALASRSLTHLGQSQLNPLCLYHPSSALQRKTIAAVKQVSRCGQVVPPCKHHARSNCLRGRSERSPELESACFEVIALFNV